MIRRALVLLLGTIGIVLGNMTMGRWMSILCSLALFFVLALRPFIELAIAYWAVSMALHYTGLFATFSTGGLKEYWIRKSICKEMAYKKFEACLSFAFFNNGLAFSYLYVAIASSLKIPIVYTSFILAAGVALQAVGFVIKFLATWRIDLPIYYYKDMFIEEKVFDFEEGGVFRFFSNTLYGWG